MKKLKFCFFVVFGIISSTNLYSNNINTYDYNLSSTPDSIMHPSDSLIGDFNDDGEFKLVSPKHNSPARGKWFLNEKTLLLKDTTFFQWGSDQFEVVIVSSGEIVMIRAAGKKTCHLKKIL
jgi:hypothetical protein